MNTILKTPSRETALNDLILGLETALLDTAIIRVEDMSLIPIKPVESVDVAVSRISAEKVGMILSLDEIEANKQKICTNEGFIGQNGYDPNIKASAVADMLIESASAVVDSPIIVMVYQKDFEELKPILEKNKISSYVVI